MAEAASSMDTRIGESLNERFLQTREFTRQLCAPLATEDCVIQSMPDASPTRWHLAHTTWFFETFILAAVPGYQPFDPAFEYLFNSYYNAVGEQFPRPSRGLLSRPSLEEIWAYRRHVDRQMRELLSGSDDRQARRVTELGIQHEQQHQELILTDIKHALSCNPLFPVYQDAPSSPVSTGRPATWLEFDEGIYAIGHEGDGFSFDNESPRHRQVVNDFEISDRLINCGDFLEFMDDDGYRRPEFWLSAGWQTVREEGWQAPLYWHYRDDRWWQFTLAGLRPVEPAEPLCHVSFFEADAFARWAGARLPTEVEWEIACQDAPVEGNFADTLLAAGVALHPACPSEDAAGAPQMFGDVWQWTASPYTAYPGYTPPQGALGEYNGKFMCNQYILRGGSCATSKSHIRRTYRNFFPPETRWQFSGLRLAR
jgi:ergothioneine biosynthesis protein EgtB